MPNTAAAHTTTIEFMTVDAMNRHPGRTNRPPQTQQQPQPLNTLSGDLGRDMSLLRARLGHSEDIVLRDFRYGAQDSFAAALIYVAGMVNQEVLDNAVLKPLLFDEAANHPYDMPTLAATMVASVSVIVRDSVDAMVDDILSGCTLLLAEGCHQGLSIGARKWPQRAVQEPSTETVVRGPRQGFVETLQSNLVMIRRIVKNPNLRIEMMTVGRQTNTSVAILSIEGVVMPGLVEAVKGRIASMDVDMVLESGNLQAAMSDAPWSIFSTVGSSERPDSVAGMIMEGRVAVAVDGSPFVLTAPCLFMESFQNPEDYYIKAYFATFMRIIRLFSYVIAMMAPAAYVALTTFHQEMLPTPLLFSMAAGHQDIPFPSLVEALLMMVLFDVLKEAGVRLPKPIGSAVSIVGALVLGQSAVDAGIISPFMVIVVAITAIASFTVPSQMNTTLLLRYFLLLCAGFLGGFGIVMALLFLLLHLSSLYSYGVPYMSPFAPVSLEGIKDSAVRMPQALLRLRPQWIGKRNPMRRKGGWT